MRFVYSRGGALLTRETRPPFVRTAGAIKGRLSALVSTSFSEIFPKRHLFDVSENDPRSPLQSVRHFSAVAFLTRINRVSRKMFGVNKRKKRKKIAVVPFFRSQDVLKRATLRGKPRSTRRKLKSNFLRLTSFVQYISSLYVLQWILKTKYNIMCGEK